MKYLAAYMLSAIAGKDNPSFQDMQAVLSAGGLDVDAENVHLVIDSLKVRNLDEVIAAGEKKLSSVPSGGGVAVASSTANDVVSSKPAAPAAPVEEKKPAKDESEEDDDMGFGLFD